LSCLEARRTLILRFSANILDSLDVICLRQPNLLTIYLVVGFAHRDDFLPRVESVTSGTAAKRGLPRKLINDAIREAVLDIRFNYDPKRMSEIFFGWIANNPSWKGFEQARAAVADIPESIRLTQADLKYQPAFVLTAPDGAVSIQAGPQVFIHARRGVYPGWDDVLWGELDSAIDHIFSVAPNLQVTRLGLRYVNALRSDIHGIRSVDDIALSFAVAGQKVTNSLNFNFAKRTGTNFETMTRVATVDLAQGIIPDNTTLIVDVDVYTSNGFQISSASAVKEWTIQAHNLEKESFFEVLGQEATERLRADK
jgi:uncharacterized protein (TIGR04255 family)